MHELVVEVGSWFSPAQYLYWTRIQCIAWTAADIALILALLQLANLCRGIVGKRKHRLSYVVLFLSAMLAPLVIWAPNGSVIFVLELLITVPHFLIILYVLAAGRLHFAQAWRMLTEESASCTWREGNQAATALHAVRRSSLQSPIE
jgi:hypothetical protein